VVVRLDAGALHERVASVEELADITAVVLLEDELAAWVELLVAIEVEDQVVED